MELNRLEPRFKSDKLNRFHQAQNIKKAYLTDMFQELVERNFHLANVDVKGGWHEIDTEEDLKRVKAFFDQEFKYVKNS